MEINFNKMSITLDEQGVVTKLSYDNTDILLKTGNGFPLVQAGISGDMVNPESLVSNGANYTFNFKNNVSATFEVVTKGNYATFEVINCSEEIQTLRMGIIPIASNTHVGDIIGVIRSENYSIGIQALNRKTLAGYPVEFEKDKPKIPQGTKELVRYNFFESAAFPYGDGSVLQLFCENRNRFRVKDIEGFKNIKIKPYTGDDYDIQGSKFAIFGCDLEKTMDVISEIEIAENLPHPTLQGKWAKTNRYSMCTYLITEFGEGNIDSVIRYAKKAGVDYFYHSEPFETWGHFVLRKDLFPNGDEGMKICCEKAAKAGFKIGVHTLTSFTKSNDTYITPVPRAELAYMGNSILSTDISVDSDCLSLEDASEFEVNTVLQAIKIEKELIQFQGVDGNTLVGLTRGAFGTSMAAHKNGTSVERLFDHPYKVFFPNIELQKEYTDRLGELFVKTGLEQISFDGLEGCRFTGEDELAVNQFCLDMWEKWQNNEVINDASRLNHNLWHMHTRMNWGEPWGAKMREGQTASRIMNQDYYSRNLFPKMLGWFSARLASRQFEATSIEDIEWALSLSAGFDSGYALAVGLDTLDSLGVADEILTAIKNWDTLRLNNKFDDNLKARLLDTATEWRLTEEDGIYTLREMDMSITLTCDLEEMQPGQPGGSDWSYINKFAPQRYDFRMRIDGDGYIENPRIYNQNGALSLNCKVSKHQYLIYRDNKAYVTDKNFNKLFDVDFTGDGLVGGFGQTGLSFGCDFGGEEAPLVQLKMFTYSESIEFQI